MFRTCRPCADDAMRRNTMIDSNQRNMIMRRCLQNLSMECGVFEPCPFDDDRFMDAIERHVRDFPLRINDRRMAARCELACAIGEHMPVVEQWVADRNVTRRTCNAFLQVFMDYKRRNEVNRAEFMAIIGVFLEKSSDSCGK